MYENGTNIGNSGDCNECKHLELDNDKLREKLTAAREVLREVFSMFINLGAIRGTNIVLQFSEDVDAEKVYDDITKKMGDLLPNNMLSVSGELKETDDHK